MALVEGADLEAFQKVSSRKKSRATARPWPDAEKTHALKNYFVLAPVAAILATAIVLIWVGLS